MASNYDATEFIDGDFQSHQSGRHSTEAMRAPSREEIDLQVSEAHQKLAELNRKKEDLERERGALEETRRRQAEFHTGRQEMIDSLTRGLGLLEEAEFAARRDAEQMAKAIAGLREALGKVQALNEQTWGRDNLNVELTRALTTIENARMEWNGARLKFPALTPGANNGAAADSKAAEPALFAEQSFFKLCRMGLALTWPLAVLALATIGVLVLLALRR